MNLRKPNFIERTLLTFPISFLTRVQYFCAIWEVRKLNQRNAVLFDLGVKEVSKKKRRQGGSFNEEYYKASVRPTRYEVSQDLRVQKQLLIQAGKWRRT